jgi:4-hydroxy-3-methylbut-2-enyl diphosphate reductase
MDTAFAMALLLAAAPTASELRLAQLERQVDQWVDGTVSRVTDNGAFVDLGGGATGLLHLSDLAWDAPKAAGEVLKVGQKLRVLVVSVDIAKARVSLTLLKPEEHPWKMVPKKYSIGQAVKGKVELVLENGVFLTLEPHVSLLIHKSELPPGKSSADYKVGETLEVMIQSIDTPRRRMGGSVRAVAK